MKKRMKGLLFGAAVAFALAGCGSSAPEGLQDNEGLSAESLIGKAHDVLEASDSFAADFRAEVQIDGSGKTVTEGIVTMVKEPLFVNVDTTLSFEGAEQEYELYLEEAEDAVNQYMSYDGEWTEMTMTEDAALVGVQIYNSLYNLETVFTAGEDWTVEEADKNLKLTGVIPEEKFYSVEEYTRWFQLAGMSGLSEVYYAGVGDVPVVVYLDGKTGAPLSYEVDLAKALETMTNNVLTELGGGTLENGVTVTSYKITSELTQLGGVEAGEIPVEAKSDAINYEKEITLLESEE